jgi:HEAT repeat protein
MSTATAAAPKRPALPDVVAEHLEEHGFLSLQRRKLLFADDFAARRLPAHDERIFAHWDGLVVNLPDSAALATDRVDAADDPWTLASAARAWLVLARPEAEAVLERWAALEPDQAPSWREALRGFDRDTLDTLIPPHLRRGLAPPALGLLADAFAWHGELSLAIEAAKHAEPAVRMAAARALGFAVAADAAEAPLRALLGDPEIATRRRAVWSLAMIDPEAALHAAREGARGAAPDPFALRVLGLLGEPEDQSLLADGAATDAGRPAAFLAMADLGTEEAIEALVRLLALPDPPTALAVTEALEQAIGRIPRKDDEAPATPEKARAAWAALGAPGGARLMRGQPRPWQGSKSEEPMLWRWRKAIARPRPDTAWLAREVPDGFFTALPSSAADPGA